MRVLVVEDEKKVAAAVRRGLEAEGFAVDVALTGHRRPLDGHREPLRRDRARHHAAGPQRLQGVRAAPRRRATGRRSSCSPRRTASTTRPRRSTPAPTTTSPSRSRSSCCSPGSARCCAAPGGRAPVVYAGRRPHARPGHAPVLARRRRGRAHRARVRGARVPPAPRRRGRVEGARSSTTCGTSRSRATRTSSRCTSATSGASSTSRSARQLIQTDPRRRATGSIPSGG